MVPVLVWVWNAASGSLSRRLGLEKGRIFDFPIVEMIWKNEALHYPMIQADHAVALGLAAAQDLQDMDRIARKINAVLKDFFARRNLKLVDLTLEFGLLHGVLKVGDDIGPESFRVWDIDKSGEFDLQRFSPGKRDSEEIIEELSNRITLH
jgi:phosphoribosylaminoimidazole-succinocarboxamide synthase